MSVKIFFCYVREDEKLLNKLKNHLRPLQQQGLIDIWYDREIGAGTPWEPQIKEHLDAAQIILLLVSDDFLNSKYAYDVEVKRALERHEKGEAKVIPIILRNVYWHEGPLGALQALPTDGIPVTDPDWHSLDKAFYNVTVGIVKVAKELASRPASLPLAVPEAKPQAAIVASPAASTLAPSSDNSSSPKSPIKEEAQQPVFPSNWEVLQQNFRAAYASDNDEAILVTADVIDKARLHYPALPTFTEQVQKRIEMAKHRKNTITTALISFRNVLKDGDMLSIIQAYEFHSKSLPLSFYLQPAEVHIIKVAQQFATAYSRRDKDALIAFDKSLKTSPLPPPLRYTQEQHLRIQRAYTMKARFQASQDGAAQRLQPAQQDQDLKTIHGSIPLRAIRKSHSNNSQSEPKDPANPLPDATAGGWIPPLPHTTRPPILGGVPPTPPLNDDDYSISPNPAASTQSLSAHATPQIIPNGGQGRSDPSDLLSAIDLTVAHRLNIVPLPDKKETGVSSPTGRPSQPLQGRRNSGTITAPGNGKPEKTNNGKRGAAIAGGAIAGGTVARPIAPRLVPVSSRGGSSRRFFNVRHAEARRRRLLFLAILLILLGTVLLGTAIFAYANAGLRHNKIPGYPLVTITYAVPNPY